MTELMWSHDFNPLEEHIFWCDIFDKLLYNNNIHFALKVTCFSFLCQLHLFISLMLLSKVTYEEHKKGIPHKDANKYEKCLLQQGGIKEN